MEAHMTRSLSFLLALVSLSACADPTVSVNVINDHPTCVVMVRLNGGEEVTLGAFEAHSFTDVREGNQSVTYRTVDGCGIFGAASNGFSTYYYEVTRCGFEADVYKADEYVVAFAQPTPTIEIYSADWEEIRPANPESDVDVTCPCVEFECPSF